MALRLKTCSPRRTALLPPLRPERLLPPGALTPAPRRQDHTSLPYALMPFAIGTASVHRDPPHDRGDHDTPLLPGRDGCYVALIWGSEKQKYFRFAPIFRLTLFLKVRNVCPSCQFVARIRACQKRDPPFLGGERQTRLHPNQATVAAKINSWEERDAVVHRCEPPQIARPLR